MPIIRHYKVTCDFIEDFVINYNTTLLIDVSLRGGINLKTMKPHEKLKQILE